MLVKSIISRLVVVTAIALLIIALLGLLLFGSEGSWFKTKSLAASAPVDKNFVKTAVTEETDEPVVQIASLSLGAEKPALEIPALSAPLRADTNAYLDRASDLAKDRKFEEALVTLNLIHSSNRNDHAVKFLEVRILSWSGKHSEAEQEFENLQTQYPNDLDVLVSFGYLHFYQRNYVEAEALFVEVLNNNPDYHDALRGLERSRTARNNK